MGHSIRRHRRLRRYLSARAIRFLQCPMKQATKHLLKWSGARRSSCQACAVVKWREVRPERRPTGVTQGALGLAPDEQGERMVPGSRGSQNTQLQKWMVAWSATVQSARAALRGWRQAGKHAEEERERERVRMRGAKKP